MAASEKPNGDDNVLFPTDHLGQPPRAWVVEPKDRTRNPYMTMRAEVATKRYKSGDFVTPYHTQHEIDDEDEL